MRSEEKLLKINQANLVHTSRFAINATSLKTSSSTVRSPVLRSSHQSPDLRQYNTQNAEERETQREAYSRLDNLLPDYDVREELENLGLLSKKRLTPNDITRVLG